jgi:hypothetical protein
VNKSRARSNALWLLLVAFSTGLGAGVATSYLQKVLPGPVNFVANSGAVWVIIAFLVTLPVARRTGPAMAAGTLSIIGEVLGYYAIASPVRHVVTSSAERALWVVAALVLGPIVGWVAHYARSGIPARQISALAAVCGVVVGEGFYALKALSYPAQGIIEIAIAGTGLVIVTWWFGRSWTARALSVPVATSVGAIVYLAYSVA